MTMLLHACCGPCGCYTTERLGEEGFTPTLYYFNPNIHPYQEYVRRWEGLRQLADYRNLPLVRENGYELEDFLAHVAAEPAKRCEYCYRVRLEKTAAKAKELGFTTFGTTLLISPYQNRERLVEIGRDLGRRYGLESHDEDFRPGFRKSQAMAKEMGLYRQGYCGCVYSEKERYYKQKT
jgi:predicted adenine nucleotide alpha hydrolase (AANH) superfamily ATPase